MRTWTVLHSELKRVTLARVLALPLSSHHEVLVLLLLLLVIDAGAAALLALVHRQVHELAGRARLGLV